MKKLLLAVAFAAAVSLKAFGAPEEARLLRFPTVGGDRIVFSYAGNLYSVGINGGKAVKLTSHVGYESFPKISPDGKTIAFTAQYDGNTEVYTMPIEGGEPVRVTYSALVSRDQIGERMGPNNIVMGWTPDGNKIVYRSKQYNFSGLRGRLCLVDAEGGVPEIIPTSEGGFCSFSPDGKHLAMNRMFREFRTWKYYRGGQADDIWINTVGTSELEKITDNDAQDIFPMWVGDKIYYLSDRDRTMNLFVYNTLDGKTEKVTDFTEYDCKFPSCSQDWIVFENGGYIYKYDTRKGGKAEKLSIYLEDDNVYSRSEYRSGLGSQRVSSVDLSPDGKRVLMVVRGDIFSLPASRGPVYHLGATPESHERNAVWSPDGKRIAWLSDKSGEYQVYVAAPDMSSEKCLTSFESGYPSNLQWAPDSKTLYFNTDARELYSLNADSGKLDCILKSDRGRISSFTLSPDGSWAAYSTELANKISAIFLYEVKTGKSWQVTDRWYDASSPVFSSDGKYLFFTSRVDFTPSYSQVEWNASMNVSSRMYLVPLAADTANPMALKSDEASAVEPAPAAKPESKGGKKAASKSDDKTPAAAPAMKVDIDGIALRITELPVNESFAQPFAEKDGKLYYNSREGTKVLDLKTLKSDKSPMPRPMAWTADMSKVLVRDGGSYKVCPFGASAGKEASVPVDEIDMVIDHKAEWKQIFDESWRITRDGFYVENMHGADWNHIYEKYAQMLPYVNHRDDLTYLIGEMLGELNVGHAYITSGESPAVPRVNTGLLGANFSKDAASGAFRIEKIFPAAIWDKNLRSPLLEPGVDAKVGEYIVEVAGRPASSLKDVTEALVGKADKTVSLRIASRADGKDARTVYVKPIADESQLAYQEWVKRNMEIVDKLSGGRIGYIHIPDMSAEGLVMFSKMYYNQLDREALIIDDRMNGGGNVSPMIIERLQREVYRISMYRNGANEPVPNEAFYGPKVCLIDKYSSSDGDLFPYSFRKLGLGKLIGTRSWGGIVGISGSKEFVDGQDMRTPFFTSYSTEGEWIIEGHGVDPDIVVDINPFDDYLGKDAQLEKAVEVLLEELKDWKPLPGTPAAPVKN